MECHNFEECEFNGNPECRLPDGMECPHGVTADKPAAENRTDIEKLIRKGKSFSRKRESIEDELIQDLTTALSTLQAENAQLRADLEYEREHADAYYEECGQWEAENEKLRAELEQVKRERDAAVKDIWVSKWTSCKYGKDCTFTSARTGFPDCAGCGDWEWRGIKED